MRKTFTIIALIILTLMLCSFSSTSTRALLPNTPIYEETDYSSSIVFNIPQNASIIRIGSTVTVLNTVWQKVQYGSFTGYVNNAYLYEKENDFTYEEHFAKATSTKMGETINIYLTNSTESAVIDTVKDGTKLQQIISNIDYGKFYEINYNGERAFVSKQNLTSALTYNQRTALIISGAALGFIILMIILIICIKRVKNPKEI